MADENKEEIIIIPRPISPFQEIFARYSIPAIKFTVGLSLVFCARKAQISKNPIFHGSPFVSFLIGSSKVIGTLGTFQGIAGLVIDK